VDELAFEKSFEAKRRFFDEGKGRSLAFRMAQLKKLKGMIKKNEKRIMEALFLDLHKSEFEAFTSEIGIIYEEINVTLKNLKTWMKPEKSGIPLVLQPSKATIYSEPLGIVLIIAPWNYPFQLALAPLVGAMAAGNCVVIKPSDQAKHTSNLLAELIGETFDEETVSVVQGPGAMIGPMLLDKFRFDHIFFTGSPSVGKQILALAAKNLTPVTLELGGKSPAVVHKDADLAVSAKRLVWAKFFNGGQTCICPDYVLVHEKVKDDFLMEVERHILLFYGENPADSPDFGRIINEKRFDILEGYLTQGHLVCGGDLDRESLFIGPTVLDQVDLEGSIMREEIFGPILPVIGYREIDQALALIRKNRYPLALYLFTKSRGIEEYMLENVEFGGGCINNAMIHVANSSLPFGGVGNSGMGLYHGKAGFDTFSHKKSIMKSDFGVELPIKFPPYGKGKITLARNFFK